MQSCHASFSPIYGFDVDHSWNRDPTRSAFYLGEPLCSIDAKVVMAMETLTASLFLGMQGCPFGSSYVKFDPGESMAACHNLPSTLPM